MPVLKLLPPYADWPSEGLEKLEATTEPSFAPAVVSQEPYPGGSLPELDRAREGTGPPSMCRSSSKPPTDEPAWLKG